MKYKIEYVFGSHEDPTHGQMIVEAEDVRQALKKVEIYLDTCGAKVDCVNPLEGEY